MRGVGVSGVWCLVSLGWEIVWDECLVQDLGGLHWFG